MLAIFILNGHLRLLRQKFTDVEEKGNFIKTSHMV